MRPVTEDRKRASVSTANKRSPAAASTTPSPSPWWSGVRHVAALPSQLLRLGGKAGALLLSPFSSSVSEGSGSSSEGSPHLYDLPNFRIMGALALLLCVGEAVQVVCWVRSHTPARPPKREEVEAKQVKEVKKIDTEADEEEEEEGEEDESRYACTPQLLLQYWEQVEHSILTSPILPSPYPFPASTADSVGTLPLNIPLDSRVPRSLGSVRGVLRHTVQIVKLLLFPTCSTPYTPPPRGDATMAGEESEDNCGCGEAQEARIQAELEGVLRLPLRGVFLYKEPPNVYDFAGTVAPSSAEDEESGRGAGPEGGSSEERLRQRTYMYALKWEALFLVWTNSVNFKLNNLKEVRKLLLNASPPLFYKAAVTTGTGPTPLDVSSTNLLLLWLLESVRRMYTCYIVNGTPGGGGGGDGGPIALQSASENLHCEEEIEEVEAYADVLFTKILARWPSLESMKEVSAFAFSTGLVSIMCCPRSAWAVLFHLYTQLKSIRRYHFTSESLSNTRHLMAYLYAASGQKYTAALIISALTVFQTQVFSLGRVLRDGLLARVEGNGGDANSSAGACASCGLGALIAAEVGRLAVQHVLSRVTSEFLAYTAHRRKQETKIRLLQALVRTPLSVMEKEVGRRGYEGGGGGSNIVTLCGPALHTSLPALDFTEEVDEILFYVEELEGVDVQLHQFAVTLLSTVWETREGLAGLHRSPSALLAVLLVALVPRTVTWAAARVASSYRQLVAAGAFPWVPSAAAALGGSEEDLDSDNEEACMLGGAEIVGHLPALRVYGADTRLVREYYRKQAQRAGEATEGEVACAAAPAAAGSGSVTVAGRRVEADAMDALLLSTRRAPQRQPATPGSGRVVGRLLNALLQELQVVLVTLPLGKLVPATGSAITDVLELVLPVVARRWALGRLVKEPKSGQRELLAFTDAVSSVESALDMLSSAADLTELILTNAAKARVLAQIVSPRRWEAVARDTRVGRQRLPYSETATVEMDAEGDEGVAAPATAIERLGEAALSLLMLAPRAVVGRVRCALQEGLVPHVFLRPQMELIAQIRLEAGCGTLARVRAPRRVASGTPRCPMRLIRSGGAADPLARWENKRTRGPACVLPSSFFEDSVAESPLVDCTNPLIYRLFAPHTIVLHCMQFRYPQCPNRNAFPRKVSLEMRLTDAGATSAGRVLAVTGPHKSGKTTLLYLLLGLYTAYAPDFSSGASPAVELLLAPRASRRAQGPASGLSSRLNSCVHSSLAQSARANRASGVLMCDLREVPTDVLRQHLFSYVPQQPILFPGTLAHNIALVNYVSIVSETLLRRARACLDHVLDCYYGPQAPGARFYAVYPSGLATRISGGSDGAGEGYRGAVRLTEEQVQLTMLARAYYHGGDVLLLDEPFQNLAAEGARRLMAKWKEEVKEGLWSGVVVCLTPQRSAHDDIISSEADEVLPILGNSASSTDPS